MSSTTSPTLWKTRVIRWGDLHHVGHHVAAMAHKDESEVTDRGQHLVRADRPERAGQSQDVAAAKA